MPSHSSEFQRKFIDEILFFGAAIEKALNENNYIALVYIINDFLESLRNIRAVIKTSIQDENDGYDPEIICTEETELTEDEFDTSALGQFPSLYTKPDHGPS
ncbi:MAG: hypothetical protein P1P90_04895 [Patescibacteria group bacterium]|nr:hypothetical protein [Patescibacteria group bacterium]